MRLTHRHADGGLYSFVGPMKGKDPSTGEWREGIHYIARDDLKSRWTDLERWKERFTELPEPEFLELASLGGTDEEGEELASFSFILTEAEDVRHMLILAANHKSRDKRIEAVLRAQADMIMQGLHIRNMEEVPDMMGDIVAFHQKFGQEYLGKPRSLKSEGQGDDTIYHFRSKFMQEEKDEYDDEQSLLDEKIAKHDEQGIAHHLELQLDALIDLVYVVLGTAYLQYGAKIFNEGWRRVHYANMQKIRADMADEDATDSGRKKTFDIVKPKGWVAPSHLDLVEDHAHLIYRQPGTMVDASTVSSDTRRI
jgi:predicted HAD superfamily Cof-like phosphohydrolase